MVIDVYACEICGETGRNRQEIEKHESIPVKGTLLDVGGIYSIFEQVHVLIHSRRFGLRHHPYYSLDYLSMEKGTTIQDRLVEDLSSEILQGKDLREISQGEFEMVMEGMKIPYEHKEHDELLTKNGQRAESRTFYSVLEKWIERFKFSGEKPIPITRGRIIKSE